MTRTLLSIEKEILKKEYAKSPLGIAERKITKFYDDLIAKKEALPEPIAKQVYDIRDENEKKTEKYIDDRVKIDKETIDEFLLESMTKELEIINKYNDNITNSK